MPTRPPLTSNVRSPLEPYNLPRPAVVAASAVCWALSALMGVAIIGYFVWRIDAVRDLVMLDPFNTRSLAFQLNTLKEHLAVLPSLHEDGMLEEPSRILLSLSADVDTEEARKLSADKVHRLERALMRFSNAVADRYFLQGASAVPTVKLMGLA